MFRPFMVLAARTGGRKPARTERARLLLVAVTLGALVLTACNSPAAATKSSDDPSGVVLDVDEATGIARIDFTGGARSAERLGIETAPAGQLTVPYAAVIYTAEGKTLVYSSPEPLVFVQYPITIERIDEDTAVLSAGPPAGTPVVTVGAAELAGIEFGVGK
jgi:hypothetical protein